MAEWFSKNCYLNFMNLRQLLYFRTVVEQGSLVAASDVLNIAQPPLSVAIRQLEATWGVSLFERSGRGLVITDTGQVVYERVCELLNHAAQLDEDIQALGEGSTGRVRIGFISAGLDAVSQTVRRLHELHPQVRFSLHQGEPRLLEDLIEQRALDFALTSFPVANPAFVAHPLSGLNFMAFSRADQSLWPAGAEICFADLATHPLVILRRSSGIGFYERVLDELHRAGVQPSLVADSSDVPAILAMVERGMGVGILPIWHLGPLSGMFRAHRIVTCRPAESLVLVHGAGRRFLPVVHEAIQTCLAIFSMSPD